MPLREKSLRSATQAMAGFRRGVGKDRMRSVGELTISSLRAEVSSFICLLSPGVPFLRAGRQSALWRSRTWWKSSGGD